MPPNPQGNVRYSGQSGPLFNLAFVTGLLTLVTLGIYRFWAKTRIRKYIWSSVSVDGDGLEYTGNGLEKFLGFLVAMVFLAVYLAAIQLLLFFIGFSAFTNPDNEIAIIISIYASFLALIPFILFAIYRSRRYKLARTRLRGIRFGMDSAAWGYALRAIGHYFLTVITLGILLPRQTFYLTKYMTDRSYYGDAKFEQRGRWQALYAALKHVLIGIALIIGGGAVIAAGTVNNTVALAILGGVVLFVGYFWVMIGFVYYQVRSFAYLASNTVLGDKVGITSSPSTGEIIKIVLVGGIVLGVAAAVLFAVLGGVFYGVVMTSVGSGQPNILLFVPIALLYVAVLVALGALGLVMITQPIIAHIASTLHITNVEALASIRQRAADPGADAEGFAEALDIGGAI